MRNRSFDVVLVVVVACLTLVLAAQSASAAVITLGNSGWKAIYPEGLDVELVAVAPDRSSVTITHRAEFRDPFDRGVGPTLAITFVQTAKNAVPKIIVNTESILNATDTAWGGYTFNVTEAMGGGGDDSVRIDPDQNLAAAAPEGVDPFSAATLDHDETELHLHGGVLASGESWSTRSGLTIVAAPDACDPGKMFFLLGQPASAPNASTPTPEPAGALGLLLLGAAGLARRHRR